MNRSSCGDLQVPGEHADVLHQVAVGEHHALGLAGGPRGVDDGRDVVRADRAARRLEPPVAAGAQRAALARSGRRGGARRSGAGPVQSGSMTTRKRSPGQALAQRRDPLEPAGVLDEGAGDARRARGCTRSPGPWSRCPAARPGPRCEMQARSQRIHSGRLSEIRPSFCPGADAEVEQGGRERLDARGQLAEGDRWRTPRRRGGGRPGAPRAGRRPAETSRRRSLPLAPPPACRTAAAADPCRRVYRESPRGA